MSQGKSINGKKYGGRHSSFIAGASALVRHVEKYKVVDKISAGIIKTGLVNLKGKKRISASNEGACLLVRIRDNISMQEVRIYTKDSEQVTEIIHEYSKQEGIGFGVKW